MPCASTSDWDVYWKWEWFKGSLSEGKFRSYFGPSVEHWDHLLRQAGARRVLDASCGPGCKSVLLVERGYEVSGSDGSAVGVQIAREVAAEAGVDIRFHEYAWHELPGEWDGSFDAVVNDALAWVGAREGLRAAMESFCRVLRPGGVLLFAGASEFDGARRTAELVAADWRGPEPQLVGRWQKDEATMLELTCHERQEDAIVCHHLYVVEEGGQVHLETARYTRLYRWGWADYQQAAREAGFGSLRSVRVDLAGLRRVHNMATK